MDWVFIGGLAVMVILEFDAVYQLSEKGLTPIYEVATELDDFKLPGEAADEEQAVDGTAELQPDVVLMDIQMPGMNGIEATREIVAASPHIGVITVSLPEDNDSIFAAARTGARGHVLPVAGRAQAIIRARCGLGSTSL